MKSLFAPWRYSYLVAEKTSVVCIFCQPPAAPDAAASLLVYQARHNFVILNRFPYSNGHVMVVPNSHLASLFQASSAVRAEMFDLAAACERVLREQYKADGINLGMNLGRAAGAGIDAHYHLHIVPRWEGDTNFMAVSADTRVIPEELPRTQSRIRVALLELLGVEPSASSTE